MPTARARFRISIKDHHTGEGLKVELVDAPGLWGERRYAIRLNVKPATDLCASVTICGSSFREAWGVRRYAQILCPLPLLATRYSLLAPHASLLRPRRRASSVT